MKTFRFLIPALFLLACTRSGEKVLITPDNTNFAYIGRFDTTDMTKPVFMYSGCAIRTVFSGTSVELIMKDDSLRNLFTVIIDDSLFVLTANESDSTYLLADSLENKKHRLDIIRRSEWHGGNTTFLGLRIDGGSQLYKPEVKARRIEFIGDSYTCGYGNEGKSQTENFRYETENNYLSYGAITARGLDAEYQAVCRSGIGIVQGYGGNRGFTMPRFYDEVIMNDSTKKWDYSRNQPQLVVINLITNDLSAPVDSAEFLNNYIAFVKRVRGNYPAASIVCCAGPSAPGKHWQTVQNFIHAAVGELTKNDNAISYFQFTPFEMHGSDWHPNTDEDAKMAAELILFLKSLMNW
jgi:hypothetical protein